MRGKGGLRARQESTPASAKNPVYTPGSVLKIKARQYERKQSRLNLYFSDLKARYENDPFSRKYDQKRDIHI